MWGRGRFAQNNNYSCGGYQWRDPAPPGLSCVFLCLIALGHPDDVKIRSPGILNVFKNEATYPAYLVWF